MRFLRLATAALISASLGCTSPGADVQQVSVIGPDVNRLLGKSIGDVPGYSQALVKSEDDRGLLDRTNSLDPRRSAPVPDFRIWRRMLIPVTWQSAHGSVTRFIVVRYRADIDRVWYIQAPVESEHDGLRFGEINSALTFDGCMRRLGSPHRTIQMAPVVRIAWWDVGAVSYRVDFISEDYAEAFREKRKSGSLRLLAVYQRDLAPEGFDDGYEFWKSLAIEEGARR